MEQTKAKLMARLRELRQSQGWVRIEVWVPKHLVPRVRAYVKRLASSASAAPFKNSGRSRGMNKGEK